MSFILTKNAGVPVKYLVEGYLENEADFQTEYLDFTLGSKITVITTGKTYVLTPTGWKYVKDVYGELDENYYDKAEIDEMFRQAIDTRFIVVDELPTENISTSAIYLVPKEDSQDENAKDEYINTDGTSEGWEKIGDTEIDLSGYMVNEGNAIAEDFRLTRDEIVLIDTTGQGCLSINDENTVLDGYYSSWVRSRNGGGYIRVTDYIHIKPGPNSIAYYDPNNAQQLTADMEIATKGDVAAVVVTPTKTTIKEVNNAGSAPTLDYIRSSETLVFNAGSATTTKNTQVVTDVTR